MTVNHRGPNYVCAMSFDAALVNSPPNDGVPIESPVCRIIKECVDAWCAQAGHTLNMGALVGKICEHDEQLVPPEPAKDESDDRLRDPAREKKRRRANRRRKIENWTNGDNAPRSVLSLVALTTALCSDGPRHASPVSRGAIAELFRWWLKGRDDAVGADIETLEIVCAVLHFDMAIRGRSTSEPKRRTRELVEAWRDDNLTASDDLKSGLEAMASILRDVLVAWVDEGGRLPGDRTPASLREPIAALGTLAGPSHGHRGGPPQKSRSNSWLSERRLASSGITCEQLADELGVPVQRLMAVKDSLLRSTKSRSDQLSQREVDLLRSRVKSVGLLTEMEQYLADCRLH